MRAVIDDKTPRSATPQASYPAKGYAVAPTFPHHAGRSCRRSLPPIEHSPNAAARPVATGPDHRERRRPCGGDESAFVTERRIDGAAHELVRGRRAVAFAPCGADHGARVCLDALDARCQTGSRAMRSRLATTRTRLCARGGARQRGDKGRAAAAAHPASTCQAVTETPSRAARTSPMISVGHDRLELSANGLRVRCSTN
jgi:hypothetical protein